MNLHFLELKISPAIGAIFEKAVNIFCLLYEF